MINGRGLVVLTEQEERFILDVRGGMHRVDAYLKLFPAKASWTRHQLMAGSARYLASPKIDARVTELHNEWLDKCISDDLWLVREAMDLATVNPADLVRHRVSPCRHCWGIGHAYQWHSEIEFGHAVSEACEKETTMPSEEGGYGYDIEGEPDPDCPICHGDGISEVIVADTRRNKRAGRLIKSIKQGRNGVEVVMRDQDYAVDRLAKLKGAIIERVQVDSANVSLVTDNPAEAFRVYQDLIKGDGRRTR